VSDPQRELARYLSDVDGMIAMAEVDVDLAPHEVDLLLRLIMNHVEERLIARGVAPCRKCGGRS
jgi:hypothetical protein